MNLALRGVAVGILTLLGALLAGVAAWSAILGYRASRWPQVGGVVQSSYAETVGRGKGRHREARITYNYEVSGHLYSSDRLSFSAGQVVDFGPQPDDMVAMYPSGAAVTVYYSPSDPSTAVLRPGEYLADVLAAGLSGLLFAGAYRAYKAAMSTGPAA